MSRRVDDGDPFNTGWNACFDKMNAEIERLRDGFRAIQKATVEGRVCEDVAWFDTITTLYDFCDLFLPSPTYERGDDVETKT